MRTLLKNGRILDPSQGMDAVGSVMMEDDLDVAATGTTKTTLYWHKVLGAVGDNVYRSTTQGSGHVKVNSSLVTTSDTDPGVINGYRFSDTGLTTNTEYFYVVKPVSAGGAEGGGGPESSDVPNAAAIPWDTGDATQIIAKMDQTSSNGWLSGAPGDVVGPNGVGYSRHSSGSAAVIVAADSPAGNGDDLSYGGEHFAFPLEPTASGASSASGETAYPANNTGPYRKVDSIAGCYSLTSYLALTQRSRPNDRSGEGRGRQGLGRHGEHLLWWILR